MKVAILTLSGLGGVQIHAQHHARLMDATLIQGHFYRFWELRHYDIIHIHYLTYHIFPVLITHWLWGIPFCVSFHGGDARLGARSWWWRQLQKLALKEASAVMAASESLRNDIWHTYHIEGVKVVHNGIDLQEIDAVLRRHGGLEARERPRDGQKSV